MWRTGRMPQCWRDVMAPRHSGSRGHEAVAIATRGERACPAGMTHTDMSADRSDVAAKVLPHLIGENSLCGKEVGFDPENVNVNRGAITLSHPIGASGTRTAPRSGAEPKIGTAEAIFGPSWIPWIFAAKTTAAGLLALLVAFAFNLDQPRWALITVFIVAQPQSGLVLAKSFYRIIGTLIGAAVALVLVSLFAQERVLFLGTLAIWIGLCTFASKHARNFASYGFVLSGYTVAIVGIPGALEPGNAFYIAIARVTEISLGIMTTGAISHLVLPVSLADSLRRAVATGRAELASYAAAVLRGGDTTLRRTKLLGLAIAIENLRASAIFEDREIERRSDALRRLNIAMLGVINVAHLLSRSLASFQRGGAVIGSALDRVKVMAAATIDLWRSGKIDVAGLRRHLIQARANLPLARELYRERLASDEQVIRGAAAIGLLHEFCAAFVAYAEAYEVFTSQEAYPVRALRFAVSNDRIGAVWAGLRAAMALILGSMFWILADWPSGYIAAILAAVVTGRLATMENVVLATMGGTLVVVLATIPSFILIEMLLPDASGFPMFALAVAPMLFFCAYLMAHKKTAGIGFLAGLYFSYTASFQNHMTYDPVGFLNASIAVALAIASAGVLFAIVAPDTPQAARRRFGRVVRKAYGRIARWRPRIGLNEFETRITDALDQLSRGLGPDRGEDLSAVEAGIALMGAGRELIRVRDAGRPTSARIEVEAQIVHFLASNQRLSLECAQRAADDAAVACLAELRDDKLGVADARAVAREMVAFTAIRDELERCGELLLDERAKGVPAHVA